MLYTFIAIILFFLSLELFQRIRYAFRFHSTYWLCYGFTARPLKYGAMMAKGLGLGEDSYILYSHSDYRKHNPEWTQCGKINSYGFRGKEFKLKKDKGVYRIVALGGSTTLGYGVKDGSTYPEFLENILNSNKIDKKFEVINAGINGTTLREMTQLFINEVIPLDADMIIINIVFNNLYFAPCVYSKPNNLLQKINKFLFSKSVFYVTFQEKMAVLLSRPMDNIYRANEKEILNHFLKDESLLPTLKDGFRNIVNIAKSNKIKVILIKEPVRLSNYKQPEKERLVLLSKNFEPVYQKIYLLLDDIAREEKVDIVDTASYFQQSPEPDLFLDGLHLTEKGNKYLAYLIAEEID